MTEIIRLPDNFIGKEDRERLESFAGHTIARGRATRWHWGKDANGDDIFEIYPGSADNTLAISISRNRELDAFCARDAAGQSITSGTLEHVFAELEAYFIRVNDDGPESYA